MKDRLNKSSSEDLERVYDAFERFGVGCHIRMYKGMKCCFHLYIGRCNQ